MMTKRITASVGKKGKNKPEDIKIIQELLNPFASKAGFGKVKVDGALTPKLEKAIGQFQLQVCGFKPDFKVDPGKTTIKNLNAGLAKMQAAKKAEDKKIQKIKEDQRAKILKAAKDAVKKEAKAKSLDDDSWGQLWKDVEGYATELYDSYFAKSEKKGEPAAKAAPKIADIVTKQAKKQATVNAIKVAKESASIYPGRLTGATKGVNKKLLNVLFEVSSFYDGTTIHVTSGLRSKSDQVRVMYKYWNAHLNNGKIYKFLRKNETHRLAMDAFVQAKDKKGFSDYMFKNINFNYISSHLTGRAADITTRTDQKIINALATVLHYVKEKDKNSEGIKCHHFDINTLVWPIPDSVKAKWKK